MNGEQDIKMVKGEQLVHRSFVRRWMNYERVKMTGRSSALAVSLLLHGLVLFSLGGVGTSGPAMESSVMITYLAMPAPVPAKAPGIEATTGKKTVTPPVQASTKPEAFPNPANVKPQPSPELVTLEKKPVVKLSTRPAAGDVREAVFEEGKPDFSELRAEEAPDAVNSENMGITVHDTESSTQDSQSLVVNSQFSVLNSQSTLLAFAGDPLSFGMIGLDAVRPDLIEARVLSLPEPVYPVLSRKRGEEGRVIIQVEISAEGKVLKAQISRSSSYSRLDSAALKAIQDAVFAPAIEHGAPVESLTKVAYRFELEGR